MTISRTMMVMRKSSARYSVAQAKAHLSEVLREAAEGPAVIHNRGRDVAVLLSIGDYQRLRSDAGVRPMTRWLARVGEWRRRTGGVEFEPEPMAFKPADVRFGARRR